MWLDIFKKLVLLVIGFCIVYAVLREDHEYHDSHEIEEIEKEEDVDELEGF